MAHLLEVLLDDPEGDPVSDDDAKVEANNPSHFQVWQQQGQRGKEQVQHAGQDVITEYFQGILGLS